MFKNYNDYNNELVNNNVDGEYSGEWDREFNQDDKIEEENNMININEKEKESLNDDITNI
jgi:hypothetical protein